MNEKTKVSQDKKVPMDATTEKGKNNSSNKEDNKNEKMEKGNVNPKNPKTVEKSKTHSR